MSGDRLIVLVMMAVNGFVLFVMEGRTRPEAGRAPRGRHARVNLVFTAFLLGLNLAFDRLAVMAGRGPSPDTAPPAWLDVLLAVVVLDGLTYAAHVLMHALPAAWRFHRVHHSDADVDVSADVDASSDSSASSDTSSDDCDTSSDSSASSDTSASADVDVDVSADVGADLTVG